MGAATRPSRGDASRGRSGWARARSPTNLGANASISAVSICTPRGTSSPAAHRTPRRDAGRAGGIPPLRARDATARARGTATFSVVDAMGLETARCRQTEREGRSRDGRLCDRGRARQPPRVCVSRGGDAETSKAEKSGADDLSGVMPSEGNFGGDARENDVDPRRRYLDILPDSVDRALDRQNR